jgi:hypothetical protein
MPEFTYPAIPIFRAHFRQLVPKRPTGADKYSERQEFFCSTRKNTDSTRHQRPKLSLPPARPLRDGSLSQLPQNCTLGLSASHPPACCRHMLWRSPRIVSRRRTASSAYPRHNSGDVQRSWYISASCACVTFVLAAAKQCRVNTRLVRRSVFQKSLSR